MLELFPVICIKRCDLFSFQLYFLVLGVVYNVEGCLQYTVYAVNRAQYCVQCAVLCWDMQMNKFVLSRPSLCAV